MSFEARGLNSVLNRVASIKENLKNLDPILKIFGDIALESIDSNFDKGGRPVKWPAPKSGGKPLNRSKKLRNSIKYKVSRQKTTVFTRLPYAAIQNYGGKISTKKGTYYMPRKRFMMLQKKDVKNMNKKLARYIVTGQV